MLCVCVCVSAVLLPACVLWRAVLRATAARVGIITYDGAARAFRAGSSLYFLILMYQVLAPRLRQWKPLYKFMSVKGLVCLCRAAASHGHAKQTLAGDAGFLYVLVRWRPCSPLFTSTPINQSREPFPGLPFALAPAAVARGAVPCVFDVS